ncbi:Uma2 family endonuclease [Virgibacillus sp. 179-BFC.A HS]|uniref:Uma2 family endonuclease n=1 Tax=Tigheibacillus jepli TaxID=3035914 RepID=A0ABU5CMU1_9BACI|nr:Uma2 family endonuclease [Virgibacillus sp. 179-BFC.A HS]MDY0406763.1 Uma2 family endonuclease [Virgibacillus sp. 179-BFC.A HS]
MSSNPPNKHQVSLEEFYSMRENSDRIYEYIDGVVYMSPSPTTMHQRISGRLHVSLFHFLEKTGCEVFHAPFDIVLNNDKADGKKIFVPDLSVICEQQGLTENNYVGAPSLIIVILSPSNQSHDLVTKLNWYMKYGVKEYWIVNPMLHTVQVYSLDDNGDYRLNDIVKNEGTIQSVVLDGFAVDAKELFR